MNELEKNILDFAIAEKCPLIFRNLNGKNAVINPSGYDSQKVYGNFLSGEPITAYNISNIESLSFKLSSHQNLFKYKNGVETTEGIVYSSVEYFNKYYKYIINIQQKSEDISGNKPNFSDMKLEKFNRIFDNIYKNPNNLLLKYFSKKEVEKSDRLDKELYLLLTKSNYTQKNAVERAIHNKISVIEGPPGTGKTTTIMNIIANLIIRGKKIVVVSKNNSAVDNIIEEFNEMNLPKFYLRMGNSKIMKELNKNIKNLINDYSENLKNLSLEKFDFSYEMLKEEYARTKNAEEKTNEIVRLKNKLEELNNQKRHVEKRNKAYEIQIQFWAKKYISHLPIDIIKNIIDFISKCSVLIEEKGKLPLNYKVFFQISFGMSEKVFKENSISLQLELEYIYIEKLIAQIQTFLNQENLENLQNMISKSYTNFNKTSKEILLKHLFKQSETKEFKNIIKKINESQDELDVWKMRNEIRSIYPLILTTVDSIISNFSDYLYGDRQIDYIIMDEASQCDILSGVPILFMAKNIIIVGDQKQLSAITDSEGYANAPKVDNCYNYYEKSFLDSVKEVFNAETTLLQEHYRCDYNIINYCNKFFYDNQLIIYTNKKSNAMKLTEVSHGKYVELFEKSFRNDREALAVLDLINYNISGKFIITPFSKQGELLKFKIPNSNNKCGTIHTFQGRGEKEVYFSTVLNDISFANAHLNGDHNLFTKELINVAVSRAKEKFNLITDRKFMEENSPLIRNLINYIDTYGETIPDKTVCLFDDLYKQMKSYSPKNKCDNVFEQTIRDYLVEYLETEKDYSILVKAKLSDLICDEKYLAENPDIKKFILREGTHVDYLIYKDQLSNPILVIELDGQYHKKEEQQRRDIKKDAALAHMNIPLWRISSKKALTKEELEFRLNKYLVQN